MNVAPGALSDQKQFYDDRFTAGYMEGFEYDVYERCRLYTVRRMVRRIGAPRTILDYGCGQGRYLTELRRMFPEAQLFGCDISDVGLTIAAAKNPDASFMKMENETVAHRDQSFDFVMSIEVLEHVRDVRRAVHEIVRLLVPRGVALITTPCANRYSLEWFLNWLSGGLQPSHDGYGRFASDEPGHLRRLSSEAANALFKEAGAELNAIRYRSHLFTALSERRVAKKHLSLSLRARIALCDWHLFRRLPNGATMIALYRKG